MRYIADTVDFELKEPTVVTLGKFDGRHRGHQKLLRTMEEVKESLGYATAIFTFSTAPLTLVTGEIATVITTSEERRSFRLHGYRKQQNRSLLLLSQNDGCSYSHR